MTTPRADIAEVLVALDGSGLAERALHPARWLASRLDVPIRLVEVVDQPCDAGLADQYLAGVAARLDVAGWNVLVDLEPVDALREAVGEGGRVLPVLASRGRNRSGQLLGSVAFRTVDEATGAVVLVGPHDGVPVACGPVVVVEDGGHAVELAACWAATVQAELHIVPFADPDELTVALVEFQAALLAVGTSEDIEGLSQVVHRAPCPVLVLPTKAVVPLPVGVNGQTMQGSHVYGEATMMETHPTKGAAKDAARREHHRAEDEAALAAMERRAARVAPTPWQQSAHLLAAEVHSDAALAHQRAAARHDLEADVEAHGIR